MNGTEENEQKQRISPRKEKERKKCRWTCVFVYDSNGTRYVDESSADAMRASEVPNERARPSSVR